MFWNKKKGFTGADLIMKTAKELHWKICPICSRRIKYENIHLAEYSNPIRVLIVHECGSVLISLKFEEVPA